MKAASERASKQGGEKGPRRRRGEDDSRADWTAAVVCPRCPFAAFHERCCTAGFYLIRCMMRGGSAEKEGSFLCFTRKQARALGHSARGLQAAGLGLGWSGAFRPLERSGKEALAVK